MSPFMIFAIVLTVVYVIYFAAMISYDLYGKKNTTKETEETFDVSSLTEEETPTSVEEESEDSLESQGIQKEVTEDGLEIYSGEDSHPANDDTSPVPEEPVSSEELNEVCNQGTEEIVPEKSFACSSEEFMDMLNKKYHQTTQRKIEKENVRDNL